LLDEIYVVSRDSSAFQDSDGEKSDTDLVVDDANSQQMSPHNGDRAQSPIQHKNGPDKHSKREPPMSPKPQRDTSSRASSSASGGKHKDVSMTHDRIVVFY